MEGVITFDTRGRVTFMSQGAESMSGWTGDEAIGRSINDIFPLADPGGESFLDRIPPVGEKREIEVLTRGGRTMVLATTGSRMVPPNSNTIQVALVIRDVTEEQALRREGQEILKADTIAATYRKPAINPCPAGQAARPPG